MSRVAQNADVPEFRGLLEPLLEDVDDDHLFAVHSALRQFGGGAPGRVSESADDDVVLQFRLKRAHP